jgi:exopolysaccharide biosynthesis predicted pyruvyltransferase EpsI
MNRYGVIARQSQQLYDAVRPFAKRNEGYALVDFPSYANVGDSAIWLGAIQLLKDLTGRDPLYTCSKGDYNRASLAAACPTGPIFILGGGNFGDIYPQHQEFRFALMRDFADRTIVQLPQSIHFGSEDALSATANAISEHGKFHLFVRDQASADIGRKVFSCPVNLAPDCAFCIGPVHPSSNKVDDFVFLRRLDREIAGADYEPLNVLGMRVSDWATEPAMPAYLKKKARAMTMLCGKFSPAAGALAKSNAQARWRFNRGVCMLSAREAVVTDRLHGMIMSVLLGVPVVAFDNSYKKVSGYQKMWMRDFLGVAVVETADQALARLTEVRQAYSHCAA